MQKIFSGEVVLIGKRKLIAEDTQTQSNMILALTRVMNTILELCIIYPFFTVRTRVLYNVQPWCFNDNL